MTEKMNLLKTGQKSRLIRSIVASSTLLWVFAKNAQADSFSVTWGEGSNTAESFLTSLSTMIMNGLLAISFCAGTGLIIWGFVSMANRDSNPQGAQGAWKKVAFGGCLVSLSFILGIVKATMKSAAGS